MMVPPSVDLQPGFTELSFQMLLLPPLAPSSLNDL